jgi:hypothetical protein
LETGETHRIFVGNLHERRPCGRYRHRWEDIKIDF